MVKSRFSAPAVTTSTAEMFVRTVALKLRLILPELTPSGAGPKSTGPPCCSPCARPGSGADKEASKPVRSSNPIQVRRVATERQRR